MLVVDLVARANPVHSAKTTDLSLIACLVIVLAVYGFVVGVLVLGSIRALNLVEPVKRSPAQQPDAARTTGAAVLRLPSARRWDEARV